MQKAASLLFALLVIAPTTSAQPAIDAPRLLRASATAAPIKIDGALEAREWSDVAVATDFVQRIPEPGKQATFRTEVRVRYDRHAMYVGARMFDPRPDSIAAPLARKDPGDVSSDWFDVIFDSYADHRTAFRFGVNPAGTKLDVYHFNDDDDDDGWDAIWDVATRIDSLGWTAEFRIPLSQLRFQRVPGEQSWGLQFYRAVARRDEWSHWAPFLPSTPGFVSTFGVLEGLANLEPPSPFEVVPYFSSQATSGKDDLASPFREPLRTSAAAGLDFRVGLGSAISVTGTLNPDFGQVEVDPAILNLSAVETFLPEKRPFFLEGAGIFGFGGPPVQAAYGSSRFVHWRRIGRAPQLNTGAEWSDAPEQTTILGAAKLSGQLGNGWSLGVINATTQQEQARTITAGVRSTAIVEPLTNYFVARAKRDLQGGRSSVGFLATSTIRALDSTVQDRLRSGAFLIGVDALRASRDRKWTASAYAIASHVSGTEKTIAATQRSSVRYFNRPDAHHLSYDATRRALGGSDAAFSVLYRGKPWFGSMQLHQTTPGYESNDLGYLSRADLRAFTLAVGATRVRSTGIIRDGRLMLYTQQARNFAGNPIYSRFGATTSAQLPSLWSVSALAAWKQSVWSDRLTRGGPMVLMPRRWELGGTVASDSRRSLLGRAGVTFENNGAGSTITELSTSLVARPAAALQISVGSAVELNHDDAQFVSAVSDATGPTFGKRYVFATLQQRTVSADARVDWTLTPALSVQVFTQPFSARSTFQHYKQLHAAHVYAFDVFGRDVGSASTLSDGRTSIDPDGAGAAPSFIVGSKQSERSFLARALRVNAVLRWEYRAGSLLYLVWQQSRNGTFDFDPLDRHRTPGLSAVQPANVFLIKASYGLGR